MTPLDELFDEIYSPTPVAQYQPHRAVQPRPRRSPEFTWMGKRKSFDKLEDSAPTLFGSVTTDDLKTLSVAIVFDKPEPQQCMEEAW